MDEIVKEQSKVGIIVDGNPDSGEVSAGVDLNGDGKADITLKTVIKDARFWYAVGSVAFIVAVTKAFGIW